jgi:hypothetical protein
MKGLPRSSARHPARRLGAAIVLGGMACQAHAQDAPGAWQWVVAPYIWGLSSTIDSRFPDSPGGTSQFDGILDTLDGAFQLHAEGSNGRWGGFTDFTYLGLSGTRQVAGFHVDSDFDMRLFELAATWHPGSQRNAGFDLFGGLRYADFDLTARLANERIPDRIFDEKSSKSFSDFMLGARYAWPLSERWTLTLRGDGSWGQTNGTWNASAVFQYRTNSGEWLLGYRYLHADLGGINDTRITADGPEIGYGFRF